VIEGISFKQLEQEEQEAWENISIEEHMERYLSEGFSKKDAMKKVAKDRGVGKREIYQALIE
jgi:16S rRNA (cytidine1402-2'-O)-methyltransferase